MVSQGYVGSYGTFCTFALLDPLINEAASDLSSADGFSEEWSKIGKLYDTIKDHWYLIEGRERDLRNSTDATPEP